MTTKKSPKAARWVITLILLAAIAAGGWYFGIYMPSQQAMAYNGLIQAKEVRNASRFGGRVVKIFVKEGDTVTAGQPMIQFDDIDLKTKIADATAALTEAKARRSLLLAGTDKAVLRQASAKVEQANQQLRLIAQGATTEQLEQSKTAVAGARLKFESAEAAYKSADKMLDEGIISRQRYQEISTAYDAAKSQFAAAEAGLKATTRGARPEDVKIARSQVSAAKAQYQQVSQGAKRQDLQIADAAVDQAESNLTALKSQLSEVSLKAPISGVISILSVSEGELIQPGRPVVTIIDPNNLWMDIYVPESQLGQVRVGQSVKVVPSAIPGVWYTGKISSISMKSEFVPDGQNSTTDKEDQASFKVKVVTSGQEQAHAKEGSKQKTDNLFLRAGMSVKIEF